MTQDHRHLLVGIRRTGDLTPLHVVHSIAGELTWLPPLARLIDERRPLYGFAAPGLNANAPMFDRLEDLAAAYLAAVRTAQPHGPYVFGGYSFGGVVAYEMARQARDAGERVDGLVVVDTYTPDSTSMRALLDRVDEGILLQAMVNVLAMDWRASAMLESDALPPGDPAGQIDVATRHLLRHCRIPHTDEALRTVLDTCHRVARRHLAMLAAYRPAPPPSPLVALLIHNTQGFIAAANALRLPDLGDAAAGRDHGWRGYLVDEPRRVGVATEHFLMMRPPALEEVARAIAAYCASIPQAGPDRPTFTRTLQ